MGSLFILIIIVFKRKERFTGPIIRLVWLCSFFGIYVGWIFVLYGIAVPYVLIT